MKVDERTVEAPKAEDQDAERERIRRGIRYCLAVFLGLRVVLTVIATAGIGLLPTLEIVDVPGWPAHETVAGWHNLFTAWERFDALWFLRIADSGYAVGDKSAVFYPLYPLVVRGVSTVLGGHPLAAGLLVSNLATFGSMIVLYFLTAGEFGERIARRSVLYLAVFPTSFFLVSPYSESLFLLLVLTALWAARRGRWEIAGLAGMAASATRNLGVLLVVPLAVEAFQQYASRREIARLVRGLAWSAVAVVGAAAYLWFWEGFSGDWLAPVKFQEAWLRERAWPHISLLAATSEAFRWIGVYPGGYHLLDWLIVIPSMAAAGWVAVRTRPMFGIYTWASLLAPLSYAFIDRPFMSMPRFLIAVFPVLWAGAVWAERRRGVHEALVAVSAAFGGILLVLFVNWYYVF